MNRVFTVIIFIIIPCIRACYSRIKRINLESPESISAKKIAKNATVVITVSVERNSSSRLGQLTFFISRPTSPKKFVKRRMRGTSSIDCNRKICNKFTLFLYGQYACCMLCKTFLSPDVQKNPYSSLWSSFCCYIRYMQVQSFFSFLTPALRTCFLIQQN